MGQLTSVARHFEDGPVGLALVKRNTPVDEALDVAGISASQVEVVAPLRASAAAQTLADWAWRSRGRAPCDCGQA